MNQEIITLTIVFSALGITLYSFIKSLIEKKPSKCSSCSGCSASCNGSNKSLLKNPKNITFQNLNVDQIKISG